MRSSCRVVAVLAFTVMLNTSALGADAGRGRALYENHCVVCHTSKVHRREPRLAADSAQLYTIVERWQAEQGLRWLRSEIDDVVYYLKVTQYNF